MTNPTLPFRHRRISKTSFFVTALPREESAIRILCGMLGIVVFAYITLVSISIVNVIARKEAMDSATALRAVVGQLERDYFATSHGVTLQSGDSLGLSPVSDTEFVHRPGAVGTAGATRNEL
ncbi:MAG: hypothetical protein G01um10148_762 [Parcubacteria group bacterium Gr01-1014_8]|nr:MAG: hypothetical protein G01um10148_762 [Parcubacteria group bacterium Gr01-1014_8]